jgi:TolB protein
VLLGLLGAALTAACGEAPPPTPGSAVSPRAAPVPGQSPSPTATSVGSTAPTSGSPIATIVQIAASPAAQAGPAAPAGPPLVVPGRAPSPSPLASPAASPSPFPIVLGRPGLLVVEQAGRIVLLDPERQQPARTLVGGPDNSAPRWAPDGRSVLIVGGLGVAAELRLVSSESGSTRRLTTNARPERGAVWSPRGDRVAYVLPRALGPGGAGDPAEPEEVWLLDVATGNDRKLADGFDPSWSPDGRSIVYATNGQRDQQGPNDNAVRIVGADGRDDREVLSVAGLPADLLASFGLPFRPATTRLRAPSWSPDGRQLVASADGHTSMAVTFDERGQVLRPWALAFEGGVGRARWSPDGARLAVESRPATGVDVVIAAVVASRRETPIGGPAAGFQASAPTWAPDGRRLALIAASPPARRGEPRQTALRLFSPDGADPGELLAVPGLRDPDWGRAP